MNAYLDFNPDTFRGKTVLLPCDDPEWSKFTRFFAENFERLGLKKLISTSYAAASKKIGAGAKRWGDWYQPSLFEMETQRRRRYGVFGTTWMEIIHMPRLRLSALRVPSRRDVWMLRYSYIRQDLMKYPSKKWVLIQALTTLGHTTMSIKSSKRHLKERKLYRKAIIIGIAAGGLALFIGQKAYLEFFSKCDDSNAVNVMRNRWGRVVRRIERKDGKLNGLFMMDYDWGSVKGNYKNDVEIGKWIGWYPGKKQVLFEALFNEVPEAITNRSGGVEYSPRLIDCTCYDSNGKVCGRVSKGVGCEVRYMPDHSLDFLKTYGYETNYFVLFHGSGLLKGQIRQLEISLKDSSAPFFKIGVFRENAAYPLSFVEENGRKATILEDGKAVPGNGNGLPAFILGETSYAIPRPDNGHLAFDHMLFCSNATLHVISADGQDGK